MLDIKLIKENPEYVKERLATRQKDYSADIDRVLALDVQRRALIARNPLYGRIICRCESVTEGEIVDAINRPIVPFSIDAIKRRTRAGMGRCQSGFCSPHVIEIIARELGIPEEEVRKRGEKAFMLSK